MALATWMLATATFFALGLTLGGGLVTNSVAELLALGAVPVAVIVVHGGRAPALGLVRPSAGAVLGAALAGTCTWYLALRVAMPIIVAMQRETHAEHISRAVLGDGAALPLVLVASALVPGVCEELLHRGVLAPALTPRLGRAGAVVVAALLFAIMHLEPARIVATLVIGLGAGLLAATTGSLWPAITLHVTNNVVALLVATGHLDLVARLTAAHPDGALALALGGTATGVVVATWAGPGGSR